MMAMWLCCTQIFCLHGGLSPALDTLDHVRALDRIQEVCVSSNDKLLTEVGITGAVEQCVVNSLTGMHAAAQPVYSNPELQAVSCSYYALY